jgi:hypothetical protein
VLEEPRGAALGHAAEQLEGLEPEQRHHGLVACGGLAGGAEDAVFVEAEDGVDAGARRRLVPGEGVVQVGWAEALLDEQSLGLGTVGRIEP